jgi:putative Holliday junction resolvase
MTINNVLGLDVGRKRIGVARVNTIARLPEPIVTLSNDNQFTSRLKELIHIYSIDIIVVGLPRSLDGNETDQSSYTRDFAKGLEYFNLPVVFQDETLSSVEAESRLSGSKTYEKSKIDSMAAVIILEDYLKTI